MDPWTYLQNLAAEADVDHDELHRRVVQRIKKLPLSEGAKAFKERVFDQVLREGKKAAIQELAKDDYELVAEVLGVGRLLVQPFFQGGATHPLICIESLDEFKPDRGGPPKSRYSLPRSRLENADVQIARSWLDAGGNSPLHSHPGDELLVVISGDVLLSVGDSGGQLLLHAGDFCHFYAENVHGTLNPGKKPAEILVIRFHQMQSANSARGQLLAMIRTFAKRWAELKATDSVPQEIQRMLARLESELRWKPLHNAADKKGLVTVDALGLGRFLRREIARTKKPLHEVVELINAYKDTDPKAKSRYSDAPRLSGLHSGDVDVPAKDLHMLAEAYGVPEMLLWHTLSQRVPNLVVVRAGVRYGDNTKSDVSDLEKREGPPLPEGVRYYFPIRHLADTDSASFVFELDPGVSTDENAHAGCEILMPLAGKIRVSFEGSDESESLSAGAREIAVFDSSVKHRIANIDKTKTARVFAIRFQNIQLPPGEDKGRRKASAPHISKTQRPSNAATSKSPPGKSWTI